MISHKTFLLLLPVVGAGLFPLAHAAPATSRANQEVQDLANFSRIRNLGISGDNATRKYFFRVASTYRKAGYPRIAAALARSTPLGRLFATPTENAYRPAAQRALRQLRTAVKGEAYVVVPATPGGRLPDFRGRAATFVENSGHAMKNIVAGRPVTTGLGKTPRPAWVSFHTGENGGTLVLNGSGTSGSGNNEGMPGLDGPGTTPLENFSVSSSQSVGWVAIGEIGFIDPSGVTMQEVGHSETSTPSGD